MQARQLVPAAMIILSGSLFAGCLPGSKPEETPEAPAAAMEDTTTEPAEGESAMVKSVTVEDGKVAVSASNFKYDVGEIRAKVGEPLTISVTNAEGFHDLLIDELEVDSGKIPAGETMDLVIPTDKPGTYEYYCSVGEHRKMGMFGKLIIE